MRILPKSVRRRPEIKVDISPRRGIHEPLTQLVDGEGPLLHTNIGRGDVIDTSIGTYWRPNVLAIAKPSAFSSDTLVK